MSTQENANFSQELVILFQSVVYKLKLIIKQTNKMLMLVAVPFKKLDYLQGYFYTAKKVVILKDADTIFLFKVYFTIISYFTLLTGVLFFSHFLLLSELFLLTLFISCTKINNFI